MRHVSLTCKNHPELRWSTKEIAVNSDGSYNGDRNIFFNGRITDPVVFYSDMSGVKCEQDTPECSCDASMLTFAPEDKILKEHYEKKL